MAGALPRWAEAKAKLEGDTLTDTTGRPGRDGVGNAQRDKDEVVRKICEQMLDLHLEQKASKGDHGAAFGATTTGRGRVEERTKAYSELRKQFAVWSNGRQDAERLTKASDVVSETHQLDSHLQQGDRSGTESREKFAGELESEVEYSTQVHLLSCAEVGALLQTTVEGTDGPRCRSGACGLCVAQLATSLANSGPNEVTFEKDEGFCGKLFRMVLISDVVGVLLSCFVAVFCVIGATFSALVLSWSIFFLGFVQAFLECAAEAQLSKVRDPSQPKVSVVRTDAEGRRSESEVDQEDICPGDVIFLELGETVPADVRVLWCSDDFEVNHSFVSGEPVPAQRLSCVEPKGCRPVDARNILFSGTVVTQGRGTCVVYATGNNTYLGIFGDRVPVSQVVNDREKWRAIRVLLLALAAARLVSVVRRGARLHPFLRWLFRVIAKNLWL